MIIPMMMACGCAATAYDGMTGEMVCVVHYGDVKSRTIVETPNLDGRCARCAYCGAIRDSSVTLPFFSHYPTGPMDRFYDGCKGWS